jgi:chromosome segregation protein
MYLKELSINGFKSFAKKSELDFSTPITAIVGPNGSGKSNVAESFRFVLGEQSVKSLRGKRGEDLIWGGSDQSARGNRASVSVSFDNTARAFALDYDEIKIERIVHRDGQNEYKINGSVVRLKDVHELLAGAHIGSTGHHIISQGEADRVITAGAKERREMIEDALGLKVYQIKKQDAERKLKKTHENSAQVESLRREAAPHLRYLKKQVERAERALAVQTELKATYSEYLKREDVYLALRSDTLQIERKVPVKNLEQLVSTITILKQQLAEAQEEPDTKDRDASEQVLQEVRANRMATERTLSTLQGQISLLQRRVDAVKIQPTAAPELISRNKLVDLIDTIKSTAEKAFSRSDASTIERTLRDVIHQLSQFIDRQEVVAVDTSAADIKELTQVTKGLAGAQTAVEKAQEIESRAIETLAAARTALESQSNNQHAAERELFAQLGRERECRQVLTTIDTELQVLERDRQEFKQELQEAVALIGRAATDYFSHPVTNSDGVVLNEEQIASEDRTTQRNRRRELEKLKIRLEELGVGATDELLKEYKETQDRDAFLAKELEDLVSSVQNLESLIADMDAQLHEQFVAGIDKISTEFNRFFTLMFGGGEAVLERTKLKSSDDESEKPATEEGVELKVSLPNKRVKGLQMLSGGERALTSIALIFAMSQVNPPPFIILDETDAALDEANSRRYGDMIEALAQKSQLVLITHNRETMARAGILYGITMGNEGISKVLSVKFDEAAVNAK